MNAVLVIRHAACKIIQVPAPLLPGHHLPLHKVSISTLISENWPYFGFWDCFYFSPLDPNPPNPPNPPLAAGRRVPRQQRLSWPSRPGMSRPSGHPVETVDDGRGRLRGACDRMDLVGDGWWISWSILICFGVLDHMDRMCDMERRG